MSHCGIEPALEDALVVELTRHEAYRRHPYRDSVGKLTIGIGRNLDDVGIRKDEAEYLCRQDIHHTWTELLQRKPFVRDLGTDWQRVLMNMAFNLGVPRLMKFKRMWSAVEKNDRQSAAAEMLNSRWALQVGRRAVELADIVRDRELLV